MTRVAEPAPEARVSRYDPASAGWGQDDIAAAARSRRIAWIVAGVAAAIVALQAIALIVLIPLKRSVPYTVLVDRQTGHVQTTPGVSLPALSESDAVRQAFLAQYVLARETFDMADYRENYRRTMLWSDRDAAASYRRDWARDNPDGVQSRYRATTRVRTIVKEVRLLSPTTAVIRFDTDQTEGAAATSGLRQPWSATVSFTSAGRPLSDGDRLFNPLGFRVVGYRRDAEVPAAVPVAIPPAPLPPQAVTEPALDAQGAPVEGGAAAPVVDGEPNLPPVGVGGEPDNLDARRQ
jgi:type IV secretion system protein VirB8